MEQPPFYEDGTPMPRCQYCGEFFTGYPGNQICADCHDHIVEMETTIAQQRADIAALVRFVEADDKLMSTDVDGDPDEVQIVSERIAHYHDQRAAIQPIIERYREGALAVTRDDDSRRCIALIVERRERIIQALSHVDGISVDDCMVARLALDDLEVQLPTNRSKRVGLPKEGE